MTNALTFYINIRPSQVRDLSQALADADITGFSPVTNSIHIPRDNMQRGVFTGADAPFAAKEINRYFTATDFLDRLPENFAHLSALGRAEFLELINVHTQWSNGYGPQALRTDVHRIRAFIARHPGETREQDPPPRPSYRTLRHPRPEPHQPHPSVSTCPVPGCDHNSYSSREPGYCWGHSYRDRTWDGVKWTTYDQALHGTECRVGKEGGLRDCDNNFPPEYLRDAYRAEHHRIKAGIPPIPGP